jgi:pimeloyl-ACP methyl ester carboxylesterase
MVIYPRRVTYPTPKDVKIQAVNFNSKDGLLLDAFLITSEDKKSLKTGLIYVHGRRLNALGGGADFLPQLLANFGYTTLAINKRNSGIYNETSLFDEVLNDIHGAVQFMGNKGYGNLVLMGHSLGGTEIIFYKAQTNDPKVKALILFGAAADLKGKNSIEYFSAVDPKNPRNAYEEFLSKARSLVKEGKGDTIMSMPVTLPSGPIFSPITAETFISYRSPESNCSALKWIGMIKVPVFSLLPKKDIHAIVDGKILHNEVSSPLSECVEIEDADHFFKGYEEIAAEKAFDWLIKIGLPPD